MHTMCTCVKTTQLKYVRLGRAPTTTSASEASTRRRRCPR